MRVLYLDGPGPQNIRLTSDGIELPDGTIRPPFDTGYDTIIVANTKGFVSYPALKALGKFGVTLSLVGKGGTPLATFIPWNRNDATLRIAQMKAHLNPKLRLTVAKALVEAKTGAPLEHARTIEEVRQEESIRATEYWGRIGVSRRSGYYGWGLHRNATTHENAAINYALGVLAIKARVAIAKVGLDPSIPFLHDPTESKDAFVFDWQEPFRSVVDAAALRFLKTHGEGSFIRDEEWVVRLTGPAARDLTREVEEALSVKVRYGGMRVPIDALMVRELRKLGHWLESPRSRLAIFGPSASTRDLRFSGLP
ncbi:MAG TPA: CRISPR-associated endonuclease Cas1 [Thermoplasmata archaeon]|nr:CRISPR-associated endonuclease Cas1 [Thermoplasmata archaeon]